MVEIISENIDISEGTVYPLLRRLTKDGYFETYLQESSGGPPRKYYKLTDKGKVRQQTLEQQWVGFIQKVQSTIKLEEE